MRKLLTIWSMSAMIAVGTAISLPAYAQTTSDRGVLRKSPSTDRGSEMKMMDQKSKMMECCNNMMQNMQDHHPQMPNQQGTEPTSPRSSN